MRRFNHNPPRSKSLLPKHLKTYLYALIPAFIAVIVCAYGVWAVYNHLAPADTDANTHSSPEVDFTPHDSVDQKSAFLKKYSQANGGSTLATSAQMKATGTYSDENGIQAFTGTFDLEGNGHFLLDLTETVELKFVDRKLETKVSPLYQSNAATLEAFLHAIQDPLLNNNGLQLSKLETTQFMGTAAYEAHIESADQRLDTTLIISASNLTIVERRNKGTTEPAQKCRYSDYRMIAGTQFPYTILITDRIGELSRISITSLKLINE